MPIKPSLTKLSNGLKIAYLETPNDPICAAHLLFPEGSGVDPLDKKGLTVLLWSLFLKGTKRRSAKKIAEDTESIGAHVGANASHDYSHVSCHAVADYFEGALKIMAEGLFEPKFADDEIEKEKTALRAAIQAKKENIFTMANEEMSLHLFKDHPYSIPSSGSETTLSTLKRDDLEQRHKQIFHPQGAVLSIAAIHPFKKMKPLLEELFGPQAWRAAGARGERIKKVSVKKLPKDPIVQALPFEQAFLMMGFPAPALGTPDFVALKMLASLLGGGMSSRLFQSLREQRGLAYDVGAYYPSRQAGSGFVVYMGLQMSKLEEASAQIKEELALIARKAVSKKELSDVKNYVKGTFILDHQTNSQRSYYVGWGEISGMGAEYDQTYIKAIDKITPARLQGVAKKILSQAPVTVQILPKKAAAPLPGPGLSSVL